MSTKATRPGSNPEGAEGAKRPSQRPQVPGAAERAEGTSEPPPGGDGARIVELGGALLDSRPQIVAEAAKAIAELAAARPGALSPITDKLVACIPSKNKRAAQAAAEALPLLAKVAPARVAKHLDRLKSSYGDATEPGKDGVVRTFTALCLASVAYQKRLEPLLCQALAEADPKTLEKWAEVVLPALKGEPHAAARAVVEGRLYEIPRPVAQRLATLLGVKLRPAPPR